jgi:hypothetical protein
MQEATRVFRQPVGMMRLSQSRKVIQGDRSCRSPLEVWTSTKQSVTLVQASTSCPRWFMKEYLIIYVRVGNSYVPSDFMVIDMWWWEVTHHLGAAIFEHRWSYHLCQCYQDLFQHQREERDFLIQESSVIIPCTSSTRLWAEEKEQQEEQEQEQEQEATTDEDSEDGHCSP